MKFWIGLLIGLLTLSSNFSSSFAYDILKETTRTADGATLCFKHYHNPLGTPVILQHGLAQNLYAWDLPVEGQSLAVYLAERGYDVWVPSLRGSGKGYYRSGDGEELWDWSVDDYIIFDVPAILHKVRESTGKKPFWVGHSMGGMIIYGYLQGVSYRYVKIGTRFKMNLDWYLPSIRSEEIYDFRVEADPELAKQRNKELAGVITVASPAAIAWKENPTILNFLLYDYFDHNLLLRTLAYSFLLKQSVAHSTKIPGGQILDFLTDDLAKLPVLGQELSAFFEYTSTQIGASTFLSAQGWNAVHMSPPIIQATLDYAIDDVSSKVLGQFGDWAEHGTFREYAIHDAERSPYVYKDHYDAITVPLLILSGDKDKLACDDIIEKVAYQGIQSKDKTYKMFPHYGHADLCNGVPAPQDVYPLITAWIEKRK